MLRTIQNTVFIGKLLHHLEKVDSTNAYIQHLLKEQKLPDGFMAIADEQFAGKGLAGNIWLAEPGKNFTGSVLLYPAFLIPQHIYFLNKAVALAVRNTVAHYLPEFSVLIKWPNDIYVSYQKIAGILIETALSNSGVQHAIIGVGMNVNQQAFPEYLSSATSIITLNNLFTDLQELSEFFCGELEKQYLLLRSYRFNKLDEQYHSNLYGMHELKLFKKDMQEFEAVIMGVNAFGKLMLSINGNEKEFAMKEVQLLMN